MISITLNNEQAESLIGLLNEVLDGTLGKVDGATMLQLGQVHEMFTTVAECKCPECIKPGLYARGYCQECYDTELCRRGE
jgi:hypothetical protein